MDQRCEALLRRLAVLDEHTVKVVLAVPDGDMSGIDERTTALVRLAGLVALQSSPQTYEWCVAAALAAGASEEEVVGVLATPRPWSGSPVSNAATDVSRRHLVADDGPRPD